MLMFVWPALGGGTITHSCDTHITNTLQPSETKPYLSNIHTAFEYRTVTSIYTLGLKIFDIRVLEIFDLKQHMKVSETRVPICGEVHILNERNCL